MRLVFPLAVVAAVVIGEAVTAEAELAVRALPRCAPGFTATPGEPNYQCYTPLIKCPAKQGYIVGTELGPSINTPGGVSLKYNCSYQKAP
jgi:hypothetical protein